MISISSLLCEATAPGDVLRYDIPEDTTSRATLSSPKSEGLSNHRRPVVVWNCTRRCNLHCAHCYAEAGNHASPGEMDTAEGKALIRQLARFGVSVLLFSGGEPLSREDIFELASFAKSQGVAPVLSTNGTLITPEVAERISEVGFREVGISLDGIGQNNDLFRGKDGAYQEALAGIRYCVARGQRVSLRLAITRSTYREIPAIFDLAEQENVERICFYHLVYAGRGANIRAEDLSHSETRAVIDLICERTLDLYRRGIPKEILTVDNHADGVYLYLKLKEQDPRRAQRALSLLRQNGGNNSGIRLGAIDELGNVHPDQFWRSHSCGNVHQKEFGDIWRDTSDPLMLRLKERKKFLKGRCARCKYLDLCNGNLRIRAEAIYGDIWAEDPACYLTDAEIGINP